MIQVQTYRLFPLSTSGWAIAASGGGGSAAATSGLDVSVGRPSLEARLLVEVPTTVVCQSLGGDTTLVDSVTVSLWQASGRDISTGSGRVQGGPFSLSGGTAFLTCDGSTQNRVVVSVLPDSGSGPFHGGPAVITVDASHAVGTCMFPGFCQTTASESDHIGPSSIKISG
jgi:hypothetical protein